MLELAPTLADLYAPVHDELVAVERVFDEEIASEFPFINEFCDTVRSYRGKMLRPALVLLSVMRSTNLPEPSSRENYSPAVEDCTYFLIRAAASRVLSAMDVMSKPSSEFK